MKIHTHCISKQSILIVLWWLNSGSDIKDFESYLDIFVCNITPVTPSKIIKALSWKYNVVRSIKSVKAERKFRKLTECTALEM